MVGCSFQFETKLMREICLRQRRVTNQFELRPRNCWARWRWRLPPGYNLWASSCRQVIRAAIWEQLIYGPAFSNSKAKPGSVSKIRQWFTTIEPGIWLQFFDPPRCSNSSQEFFKWGLVQSDQLWEVNSLSWQILAKALKRTKWEELRY